MVKSPIFVPQSHSSSNISALHGSAGPFDRLLNNSMLRRFREVFPTPVAENKVIALTGAGVRKAIPCTMLRFDSLTFTWSVPGCTTHGMSIFHLLRRRFQATREHYRLGPGTVPRPATMTPPSPSADIFHYVYAVLRPPRLPLPLCRADLERELPRASLSWVRQRMSTPPDTSRVAAAECAAQGVSPGTQAQRRVPFHCCRRPAREALAPERHKDVFWRLAEAAVASPTCHVHYEINNPNCDARSTLEPRRASCGLPRHH